MQTRLTVPPDAENQRLDRYVASTLEVVSRSLIGRLIQEGRVTVNGERPRKRGHAIDPGDIITIDGDLTATPDTGVAAERSPLRVLFEDDHILAIDKPPGVAVHPGPGHPTGTIVNALLGRDGPLSTIGGDERPGIVHRLDKDTSGVMLAAKTNAAHTALSRQFQSRSVEKVYIALLRGIMEPPVGAIEAALGRDPNNRQRMAVVVAGRPALTRYRVLAHLRSGSTLVEAQPQTGRPHQIRVHFASLRHPVAGDVIYARGSRDPVPRLFLHARSLTFTHPDTAETLRIQSPLADDLSACLADLTAGTPEAQLIESLR